MQSIQTHPGVPEFALGSPEKPDKAGERSQYRLSLRANFLWTFAGNVIYSGAQWGLVIALAKLGSPELVGQLALAFAVTAPILMFTNLQLRGVQATDAKYEYCFSDYFSLRLMSTVVALLFIVGFAFLSNHRRDTTLIILTIGLAKGFESISDIFYGLLQQHERMDRIAISMILKGLLSLILFSAILYTTGNLFWSVLGLACVWAVVLIGFDAPSGALILDRSLRLSNQTTRENVGRLDTLRPHLRLRILKRLCWLALPLGVVMLLISLNTNIPRYFLEHYFGERALGIFAAMAYLMVVGTTVVNALGQSASPRLSQYYAAKEFHRFRSLLVRLVIIGAIIGGAGVLAVLTVGRHILSLLYGREYTGQVDVFFCLMLSAGFGYIASFLGYGMTAARYFKVQTLLFSVTCAATIVGCVLLIPSKGPLGAPLALVISTALQMLLSLFIIRRAIQAN